VEKQIDIAAAVRQFGDIAERYCATVEKLQPCKDMNAPAQQVWAMGG
jgi:hypothetical protein